MTLVQKEVKRITMRPNGSEVQIRPVVPKPVTTAGIYHDEVNGLISLSSDGNTWKTIADKNEGATTAWNGTDAITSSSTFLGTWYTRNSITASTGFHIPTRAEYTNINGIGQSIGAWQDKKGIDMMTMLRMAYYGYFNGSTYTDTSKGYFWTSDTTYSSNYYMLFDTSSISNTNTQANSNSKQFLIRSIADTPVQPDTSRTVIYQ